MDEIARGERRIAANEIRHTAHDRVSHGEHGCEDVERLVDDDGADVRTFRRS